MKKENYEFVRYIASNSGTRWADFDEIKNSPTVSHLNIETDDCQAQMGGIPIISDGRTVYVDYTDTHSIIFGSTGSKKTRLFGMPLLNILAMSGESFIATDPKGELYKRTSGFVAAKGYKTVVLDFRDLKKSDLWNPLALPYELHHTGHTEEAVSLINDLITALAEPQRISTKDTYFIDLACAQALANMLFFIDTATPQEANIYNFANFFATTCSPDITEKLSKLVADGSIASINYKGVLTNKDVSKTFANVSSCVSVMMNPFIIRKTLCQALSQSSFDIRSIGETKTAIYIIVPDEKTTLHFLVTMFIKQTYEALINVAQQKADGKLPVRVNFVLDEFANIPAIPDMPAMISAARSRNMRFFLMVQGMRQLERKYDQDAHTIKGNCDNWVFLTSREIDLLKEISDLCGEIQYKDSDNSIKSRPIISTSELQRFKKECGETLILHGRNYPLVTELPDIDEYNFKKYDPVEIDKHKLPEIVMYDADKVIKSIEDHNRPLPFSVKVYGKEMYYEKQPEEPKKKDFLDW